VNYDAVVFDNDGVLLDLTGEETHRAGARDAFEAVGVTDPDPADVEAMSIGVTVPELTAVCDRYGLDVERFWRARDRALSERQRDLMRAGHKRPYDDVGHLDRLSRPLGVVSSNQQATVEFAYDHFGLAGHFETVRARPPTVESLRRKKPDPHYVEAALSELGVESALYVGDSEHDVEAAHAAGVDAAFLRRPHTRGRTLSVDPEHDLSGLDEVAALFD
jgi:HAD superfamily hydrolase (TIGR01509 family)